MGELVRGSVADRPWGRTFAALGLRGVTGQLTLVAESRRFLVAFESGAVVAAASPLASDAAVRVALTSHLVSSTQVPEIARRQAAAPERDEIELIAELARLGPEHALRLRRRVIAQRAARTFSINHGEFVVTDDTEMTILPGCELDVRAVIYMGARTNLSEHRLSAELDQLGARFRLKPARDEDLPQFGFTDLEQPVVERLRDGGTITEIEEFATSFVDGRTVRAVVYSLAACNACDVVPGRPAATQVRAISPTMPPLAAGATQAAAPKAPLTTQSGVVPPAGARPPAAPRTSTQPPRAASPTAPPEAPRAVRPTPTPVRPPTPVPPVSREATPIELGRPGLVATRPPTSPPKLATGSAALPRLDSLDPPTQRDASSAAIYRPPEEPRPLARSNPAMHLPFDAPTLREGANPVMPRSFDAPTLRDVQPPDVTLPPAVRHDRSSPALRLPLEEAVRPDRSGPALRLPPEEAVRPDRSSPALRPPPEEAVRPDRSSPALRLPPEEAVRPDRSSPALRLPPDAGEVSQPEPVILRVPSARPSPRQRQIQRTDSPQAHDIKVLIAQRLKLLDEGADHFALLGVTQDVTPEPLRRAYFALARQLHPDRLAALGIADDGKHAQRLFAQINAGFAILSDQERRAEYLDVLRRGGEAAVRAEQAHTEELTRRILDAEEAFHRGELALKRDQPQAAITELERAIQLNPDEADYHALLAWSQFCAAPDKKTVAPMTRLMLDKAIQRSPKSPTARFYLGRVERMLGRDQEALRHFRDVLAGFPGHTDAAAELRVLETRLAGGDKPGGGLFGRSKR